MKKILLTGGRGFIGKNIKESYLFEKYEFFVPSKLELDVSNTQSVDDFFKGKTFDCVIHAACKPGHRNASDHSNVFYTNIRMFANLERHRDKYEKFINCGSGAIYDISADITDVSENDLFKKMGKDDTSFCKYIISKQIHNLPGFVDLNLFGVFGKYEDYEIRFISNAICKTLFDLPITLRQNRRFSYLFIDDLYPILEYFIENNAQYKSYNVTPDSFINLYDLAVLVKEISEKNIPIIVSQEGFGLDYYGNNSLLKTEFKKLCFNFIESSIKSLYMYYSENKNSLVYEKLLKDK